METLQNSFICVECGERWDNEWKMERSDGTPICRGCWRYKYVEHKFTRRISAAIKEVEFNYKEESEV